MSEAPKVFTARMSEQFKKAGQNVKEFMEELKALSSGDKLTYCRWLNEAGLPTQEPSAPTAPPA